jgi:hypothetical protein
LLSSDQVQIIYLVLTGVLRRQTLHIALRLVAYHILIHSFQGYAVKCTLASVTRNTHPHVIFSRISSLSFDTAIVLSLLLCIGASKLAVCNISSNSGIM